jgi:hypothetical protein
MRSSFFELRIAMNVSLLFSLFLQCFFVVVVVVVEKCAHDICICICILGGKGDVLFSFGFSISLIVV